MSPLKSTTAIALGLSLSMQGPVFAQGQGQGQGRALGQVRQLATELGVELCGDVPTAPCLTEDRALLVAGNAGLDGLEACSDGTLPCVTEGGLVALDPASDAARDAMMENLRSLGYIGTGESAVVAPPAPSRVVPSSTTS